MPQAPTYQAGMRRLRTRVPELTNVNVVEIWPDSPGRGPFVWALGGAVFNGVHDSVSYLGYNVRGGGSLIEAGEPGFVWNIETIYDEGAPGGDHTMEVYWEYHSADNLVTFRPLFTSINRTTNTSQMATQFPAAGGTWAFENKGAVGTWLRIGAAALEVFKPIPWQWPVAGAKQLLTGLNFAGDATVQFVGLDASNQLLLGGTPGGAALARTIASTPLQWQGSSAAGWQDAGRASAGSAADNSGLTFDFSPNGFQGLRIKAGRWTSTDRGGRLIGMNSGGTETVYLHLNGDGTAVQIASNIWGVRFHINATGFGVWGVTPVARPAAYTQTYATATRTHSNPTSAALTDSTTGTADTTVADVGVIFSQATLNNNFADLVAQVNALRADVVNAKGVLNQVVDDMQAYGWLQ